MGAFSRNLTVEVFLPKNKARGHGFNRRRLTFSTTDRFSQEIQCLFVHVFFSVKHEVT